MEAGYYPRPEQLMILGRSERLMNAFATATGLNVGSDILASAREMLPMEHCLMTLHDPEELRKAVQNMSERHTCL